MKYPGKLWSVKPKLGYSAALHPAFALFPLLITHICFVNARLSANTGLHAYQLIKYI